MSTVAITQHDDITVALPEALQCLDVQSLVEGKEVAIKPNDTWASSDDVTAVTQPDTLQAVIRYIKRFKPKHIVVTGGAGAAETDDVFRISGMMEVIAEEAVEFFDHNRPPFKEVELTYAPDKDVQGPQRSVMVNPRVLEYEALISLAQLKVHETATVTLSMKNIAMSYPAADYYGHPRGKQQQPHQFFDDMHSFIAAMAKRFPISLAINVGHPAMVALGPIGGHVVETGMVVASRDPVAADLAGATLLGFSSQGARHIMEAGLLGVGVYRRSGLEFPSLTLDEAFALFTEKVYGHSLRLSHP